jgi:4-hydroxy-2-oxoheptanedioate aldolase
MVFVGPWDLSIALGTTVDDFITSGQESALARIAAVCREHGVIAGAYAGSDSFSRFLLGLGYQVLATDSDTNRLLRARPPAASAGGADESGGGGVSPY